MFDYKNCDIKTFNKKLKKLQRCHENGNLKYTPKFVFLNGLGLDKKNWKRDLTRDFIVDNAEKLQMLVNKFDDNQLIVMDLMLVQGKADVIWKTTYANEYLVEQSEEIVEQVASLILDHNKKMVEV